MVDTLDLKSNLVKGIGSSPMVGSFFFQGYSFKGKILDSKSKVMSSNLIISVQFNIYIDIEIEKNNY